MKVQGTIQVVYQSTNNADEAKKWLATVPDLFAADFEAAVRYTEEEIAEAKETMANEKLPKKTRVLSQAIANATALGHPYHCTITHCSIAISEKEAFVFIIDNQEIADVVLGFLIGTNKVQVWHNYSYDGRLLWYYGDGYAKNVEDTQVFAKTLVNHVEVHKAMTGLKALAGDWYGDWGISTDYFTIEQQYEEKVLHYAAIDAAATYKLYHYLIEWCESENNKDSDEELQSSQPIAI